LSSEEGKELAAAYGGSPPGSDGPGDGDGGRGDGDDGGNGSGPAGALVAGKALETLPAELAQALKDGKLPAEMIQRYLELSQSPFFAWLMTFGYEYTHILPCKVQCLMSFIPPPPHSTVDYLPKNSCRGFRERLMADPSFMIKVAIEVGIGICTKTTAEYAKRGEQFNSQLDFVTANVIMALIADFMLVWLPAPTFSVKYVQGFLFTANNE